MVTGASIIALHRRREELDETQLDTSRAHLGRRSVHRKSEFMQDQISAKRALDEVMLDKLNGISRSLTILH